MCGEMVSMKEASKILWGTSDRAAYMRTLRLVKQKDLTTVQLDHGNSKIWVSRAEIEKVPGIKMPSSL